MTDHNFNVAKNWFEDLQNQLIKIITEIDGSNFIKTNWAHRHQGGGTMAKIKGSVVEKGGVNISSVSGKFSTQMQDKIPGAKDNPNYKATGISVVLHPMSPKIPSMHFNTRYLMTTEQWFGGGMDITPCMKFENLELYHQGLKKICDKHDSKKYSEYKKWCDDYFYLPHRKEARGAGGIFFDYLQTNGRTILNLLKILESILEISFNQRSKI